MSVYIQYGCGLCAPRNWTNFDASPTITLQRVPVLGRALRGKKYPQFPSNIRVANITKGLPVKEGTADLVYCSHVLEHLALDELRVALRNTLAMLKPGGTFRCVLPDLEHLASEMLASEAADRTSTFMRASMLGREKRNRSLNALLRFWLGGSAHLWMWDYRGLKAELESAGFAAVRRARRADSEHMTFSAVESPER